MIAGLYPDAVGRDRCLSAGHGPRHPCAGQANASGRHGSMPQAGRWRRFGAVTDDPADVLDVEAGAVTAHGERCLDAHSFGGMRGHRVGMVGYQGHDVT